MKFLLSIGLLSVIAIGSSRSQSRPHCHMQELWSCAEIAIDWFHSLPKRQIPTTESDIEVMCTEITKAVDCAFGYRDNCTTPLQKELIGLTTEGATTLQKEFCTPGSSIRAKYLSHSECINKVSQMDAIKENLEYILAILEKAQSVPESQWISYACCGYTKMYNTYVKLGRDNCGQEAVDTILELIRVAVAQVPDVICSGYTGEEDKCTAILPPAGSKPTDAVKELAMYKFIRDLYKNWLD